jgi:hypothetical protein
MADIAPTVLFPGFELVSANGTVTADSIVIPLADLPGLTAAEANPTTGDGREIARQLDIAIHEAYAGLSSEARPTAMTSTLGIGAMANGDRRVTITKTYLLSAPVNELSLVAEG